MVLCCTAQDDARELIYDHLPTPSEFEPSKARLRHMIIIGHTTPTTSRIWAKVPTLGKWSVVLSTKKIRPTLVEAKDCIVQTHTFEDGDALNYCFEFSDLVADTRYYYVLTEGSGIDAIKTEGPLPLIGGADGAMGDAQEYFRTAKTKCDGITFAAYSCHDPYSWEAGKAVDGAWAQLADVKDRLDLTIGGGDQVYVDSNEIAMTDLWIFLKDYMDQVKAKFVADGKIKEDDLMKYLTQLIREYYQVYWNFPKLAEVHRRVPAYMMWDDHEIMDGWGSVNREERIVKLKKKTRLRHMEDDDLIETMAQMTFIAASRVYNEYQHSHNPGPNLLPGDDPKAFIWDYTFNRGDYHFFALDMRGAHNCETDANRLLGIGQHRRLQEWLDGLESAGAKSAFVIAPVPVVHWSSIVEYSQLVISSLKDDLMDGWGHPSNHVERAKLLMALFTTSHKLRIPITIVSGDVHCASAYTLTDEKNYPNARLLQVTSSSISRKPCGSLATMAYAPTGLMQERLNDGKGKVVKTSIYQKQVFAKAGVNNFVVIGASKGGDLDVEFYWPSGNGSGVESAKVELQ